MNMTENFPAENPAQYLQAIADAWLPIREVARQTGVNAVTLRAWERRYGLIVPHRTQKGHRLYDQSHVARISHILTWIDRGVAVSQVGQLLENREPPAVTDDSLWSEQRSRMQQALVRLNEAQLDDVFNNLLALYPVDTLLERLLLPLTEMLQQRWQGQFGSHIERVFFQTWLRNKLGARIYHNNRQQHAQRLLMVNLCERPMEPALWLTGWLLSSHEMPLDILDWPVPLSELGLALDSIQPRALVLFAGQSLDARHLERHLPRMASSSGIPLILSGPAASIHAQELHDVPGLHAAYSPLDVLQQIHNLIKTGDMT